MNEGRSEIVRQVFFCLEMKDEGLQDWMDQLQRQLGRGGGGGVARGVAPGVSRALMSRHRACAQMARSLDRNRAQRN